MLWIDQAQQLVHPHDGHSKVFAMLRSYIDESGIHENSSQICCVGGYFGVISEWRNFERHWRKELDRAGIEEFHAQRFWQRNPEGHRVKPYQDWNDQKAEKFIDRLLTIVTEHRIFPTGATVVKSAWDELSDDRKVFLTGGRWHKMKNRWITTGARSRPYFLGFQFAILNPARYCRADDKIHFAFDLNEQLKGYALDLFELLKNDPTLSIRDRLGEISFPTSTEAVQLQAADLLVYQVYQYGKKRLVEERPTRNEILKSAMHRFRDKHDWPFFNTEGLAQALKGAPL